MRYLFAIALCVATLSAETRHRMYVSSVASKGWVAGLPVRQSGLAVRDPGGAFRPLGFSHPLVQGIAFQGSTLWLAAGNGAVRSDDGGKTWRITTSWDMTELQDVDADSANVYVALPDGVGVSRDGGKTWAHKDAGFTRKYTHAVKVDRTKTGRVFRGGEAGVWVSEDAGETWRAACREAAETTEIQQSPHDPKLWMAATQHAGLWVSRDGGGAWTRVAGVDGSRTIYNIAFDPRSAARIAVSGWGVGALVSEDGGATWLRRHDGQIWRVAWDPDIDGRLYAAVHEDALYQSDIAGRAWRKIGLEGSIVYDIAFTPEIGLDTFEGRRLEVIRTHAASEERGSYTTMAAKYWLNEECVWCSPKLIELLKEPSGDMFWMFPVTALAYTEKGRLSPEARTALRRAWKTYMPFRGDTENHWLLYYTSLYLMSQKWKGEPGSEWYTGKSSEENMAEARGWIEQWMDLTVKRGQGEYDCTHYIGVYFLPLSYLAAWAEDPLLKQKAHVMLEMLMADFGVETLHGLFVGAHARSDDRMVKEKWAGVASDFSWLLFGEGYPYPGFYSYTSLAAMAGLFDPPAATKAMSTDRTECYTHVETKRTRHRWRFEDERNGDVYKMTYMCPDYAVGSDQGGMLQPVQQHSWDVTWSLPDPRGKENTLFAMHPYSGLRELQMYFTFMPDFGTEGVVRSKKMYDSPDKLLSGSFYEQVAQDRDAIVALYDIPKGTKYEHINGFFSKDLDKLEEDASGWLFAQGGKAWIAFRPLQPYEWKPIEGGGRRMVSAHLHNAVVMQVASPREFGSWEEFKGKVRALKLESRMDPRPVVQFETLRGHVLECEYGVAPKVDGKEIVRGKKMYDSRWMQQERGSNKLTLRGAGQERLLDFDKWQASDVR
ncbi:MAG TPA: hypothetical protein VGK29_21210 [Paludibaculum sp.]|jgi:hypothetical protein